MSNVNLFNEIEEVGFRQHCRAAALATIINRNTDENGMCTPKGALEAFVYFTAIPQEDKKDVHARFLVMMKEEGYEQPSA